MSTMQPSAQTLPRRGNRGRTFLIVVFLLAAAFLGGFVPNWMKVRTLRTTLATTETQLELANLHRLLGVASHEVQRNNYGSAGEAAGRFFSECAELAKSDAFAEEPRTRVALESYAEQRDQIMALIAAGDPAVRERLLSMYLTMDGVLARRSTP
jgi:hypothetical protein